MMSKFGFNSDDYRPPAKDPNVTRMLTAATVGTGVLDTNLDYALRYAALGWYVLPVRADKKPLEGYGLNSATIDPHTIRLIWTAHPQANIAIACEASGLVVLDVDPRNGGAHSLDELERNHGPLNPTVVARTQGGGQHLFFKATPDSEYPGTLGPGLDVKYRGYVLVEPSQGLLGVYKWVEDKDPTQGSFPSTSPLALRATPHRHDLHATTGPGSVIVAPQVYEDLRLALRAIPPESEYHTWFKVLQGLSRLNDEDKAFALALEWSTASARPGHTEEALRAKWRTCMGENYVVSYQSVFYLADQHNAGWRGEAGRHATDSFTLQPLTPEELASARLHPRIVLPHMLYADVRTRISAGGVGKTTLALYEAVTLALGRELWGRVPERPMRTVIVTREDTREILAARAREIMITMGLSMELVLQALDNLQIVDLSSISYRISEVKDDVVTPHMRNLKWLGELLRGFRPDWLIMDPMVSFGVGEQRVNDAEQGLIEAMRILRAEFDCCVEGIHHSGKVNAREKTLDQYSGRGGSAMADGSRMVCVMQPLDAQEWETATGTGLSEGDSGIVMAMPKMSYCRPQEPVYIKRTGYSFVQVTPQAQPSANEMEKGVEDAVYAAVKDAWLQNSPLSLQSLKEDYKTLFCGKLKRDPILEAVGRLKRDGRLLQHNPTGGRGTRSVLEPVILTPENTSKFYVQD